MTSRALTCIRSITIEPLVFFYAAGEQILHLARTNGLYWKLCMQGYSHVGGIDCLDFQGLPKPVRDDIQRQMTQWTLFNALAFLLPIAIIGPLFGAYADRYGRKPIILLGLTGVMLFDAFFMFELIFALEMPMYLFPIAIAVQTLTGSAASITVAGYAYIADSVKDQKSLTVRFALLHLLSNISGLAFSSLGGLLLAHFSYPQMALFGMALISMGFFYAAFFLRETRKAKKIIVVEPEPQVDELLDDINVSIKTSVKPEVSNDLENTFEASGNLTLQSEDDKEILLPETSENASCNPLQSLQLIREAVQTALQPREGHFRAYIWTCLVAYFLVDVAVAGVWPIMNLFELNEPLLWSPVQIAFYTSFAEVVHIVGLACSLVLKYFSFHETTIILFALISMIARLALTAFARDSAMMYIAGASGFASLLFFPVMKSLVTQFVDKDEVGKVYAMFQLVMDAAAIFAIVGLNQLYYATLATFPGAVFLMGVALLAVALAAVFVVHVDYRHYRRSIFETVAQ